MDLQDAYIFEDFLRKGELYFHAVFENLLQSKNEFKVYSSLELMFETRDETQERKDILADATTNVISSLFEALKQEILWKYNAAVENEIYDKLVQHFHRLLSEKITLL